MRKFLEHLRKGDFRIPVCGSCRSKVWPPSQVCQQCLSKTSLEKLESTGTLIEFTRSHIRGNEGAYGVIEISGVRIVGSLAGGQLEEGITVRMTKCGIRDDGTAFYMFEPMRT